MKKSIMRISITGFAVVVAFLLMGCEDSASPNNDGLVDGFLVRVNEKPEAGTGSGSETKYEVKVSSDASDATGGGKYLKDMAVIIDAGTAPIGRPFVKWTTASEGVVFLDSGKVRTQFTMPANDVTVTAVFWTYSGWGTITDSRDGKKYRTTSIGGKRWMAENLNYTPSSGNSWCYQDDNLKCVDYGRLYDWETAKTVCPAGWHLPSRQEWGDLAKAAGGTGDYGTSGTAGWNLKAMNGWNSNGNGTDKFGFSALPGGIRSPEGDFAEAGGGGGWWTATAQWGGSSRYVYFRYMGYNVGNVLENEEYDFDDNADDGLSVRCVQND